MGTELRREVSLFDVVDENASSKKSNGAVSGVNNAVTSLINRWNGRPYTQRYYNILEKRKTLPVWHKKDEFLKALKANQSLILVGETGSGKSTQVSHKVFRLLLFYRFLNGIYFAECQFVNLVFSFEVSNAVWIGKLNLGLLFNN